jgi:AraC-like DNA-binding protein
VLVERHETEVAAWERARREPRAELRPFLLGGHEGWAHERGETRPLREVPFPGIPLILNLGAPWEIEGPAAPQVRLDSFVAGMHAAPAIVRAGEPGWACVELRLTPLGAHRVLGVPMHELVNRSVELEDVLPGAHELTGRVRDVGTWAERFDLVEAFLVRRLAGSAPSAPEVEWSWHRLRRSGGRASIGELAAELGWSHRRLIARFREQVGLAPKAAARVLRFDRAVGALRAPRTVGLAEVAIECGYFDQAHLNRDFRELAGTTPGAFLRATSESGAVVA